MVCEDGVSINVVQDPWFCSLSLEWWLALINILAIKDTMVKDFIVGDHMWNQATLAQAFSKDLVDKILSLAIFRGKFGYRLGWGVSSGSMMKVSNLYCIFSIKTQRTPNFVWAWH